MSEKQYLTLVKMIKAGGVDVYNERTGKTCRTLLHQTFQYMPNEFPVLTTRKINWKGAIAELLGYLRGVTDAAEFDRLGTKTWYANANKTKAWLDNPNRKGDGDMGKAYQFGSLGYYQEVDPIKNSKPLFQDIPYQNPVLEVMMNTEDKLIGKEFNTNSGCFRIVSFEGKSSDNRIKYYKIQFLRTGYITIIQKSQLKNLNIKDPYYPSVLGIACQGEITDDMQEDARLLRKTWSHMIERCYDKTSKHYCRYGEKGIWVCDRWLIFSNFVKDFKSTCNWHLKKVFPGEYSIDKDWCHSNCYSVNTVRWATKTEQSRNTINVKTYEVEHNGEIFVVKGIQALAELKGVTKAQAWKLAKNYKQVTTKNISYIEVDQVKSLYAFLRLGIDDRGLIMSAWHPHLDQFACLRPCLYEHHFSLVDGRLFLHSTQRSCDVPLGLPYNMIQCYVLLALMAQVTGHKVGLATHQIVNAHIYEDQLPAMEDLLERKPFLPPKLKINPNIKTLQDVMTWVTVDDFEIVGYECHDAIKIPFSE